ncbi:MAG: YgjV family protein [Clostridia bacterium]|nr:YgjV family protein [Clostridia bacterium]
MKLLGEIFGVLAVVIGFFIFQQRHRKKVLMAKLLCDLLWTAHFLLLGAMTGMAISLIGTLREIFFSIIDRRQEKRNILFLFLFLSANAVSVALTWNSPWSICSLVSGMLSTIAFWQNSPDKTKKIAFVVCISQMTYAVAMRSYAAMINETIAMTSIIFFFVRTAKFKKVSTSDVKGEENE